MCSSRWTLCLAGFLLAVGCATRPPLASIVSKEHPSEEGDADPFGDEFPDLFSNYSGPYPLCGMNTPARALKWSSRETSKASEGCALRNTEDCFGSALAHERMGHVRKAWEEFDQACALGSQDACYCSAISWINRRKPDWAERGVKAACASGHQDSCTMAAFFSSQRGDEAAAVLGYHASCSRGSPRGCASLGTIEEKHGRLPEAEAHYKRACDLQLGWGCGNLYSLDAMKRKHAIAREEASLGTLRDQACALGDFGECQLTRRNHRQLKPVLAQACRLGFFDACHGLYELGSAYNSLAESQQARDALCARPDVHCQAKGPGADQPIGTSDESFDAEVKQIKKQALWSNVFTEMTTEKARRKTFRSRVIRFIRFLD